MKTTITLLLLSLCSCAVQTAPLGKDWRIGYSGTVTGDQSDSFVNGPAGSAKIDRKSRSHAVEAAYSVGRGFEFGVRGGHNQFREQITTDTGVSRGTGRAITIAPTARYYYDNEGNYRWWIEGSVGYAQLSRGPNDQDKTIGSFGVGVSLFKPEISVGQLDIGLRRDWIIGDEDFFDYERTKLFFGFSLRF